VPDPSDPAAPQTPPEGRPAAGAIPDPRDQQLADLRALVARARADYDNLQKRVARDAALERERAKARVLEGLLPVYELSAMAAHQAHAHPGPVSEGVILLAREFRRLLEREGLSPVDEVGAAFDRAIHEAVAEEAVEGVEPGHVSRIVQAGYRLGDKVLRFAKVAVQPDFAEGGAAADSADGDAAAAQKSGAEGGDDPDEDDDLHRVTGDGD
jgi:molecular chaperone GrpE